MPPKFDLYVLYNFLIRYGPILSISKVNDTGNLPLDTWSAMIAMNRKRDLNTLLELESLHMYGTWVRVTTEHPDTKEFPNGKFESQETVLSSQKNKQFPESRSGQYQSRSFAKPTLAGAVSNSLVSKKRYARRFKMRKSRMADYRFQGDSRPLNLGCNLNWQVYEKN